MKIVCILPYRIVLSCGAKFSSCKHSNKLSLFVTVNICKFTVFSYICKGF